MDWGDAGGHLGFRGHIEVPASGVAERTCYIVRLDTFQGGMVRIGAVHYNTVEGLRRLGDALPAMVT